MPKATPFADVRSYLPAQDQWSECPLSEHGTWEPPWAPSPRSQPQAPSALPAAHPGSCPCSLREPVQGALLRPAWEGAFPGPPGGSHVLVMKTEARMRVTFFRKTRHSECPHVGGVCVQPAFSGSRQCFRNPAWGFRKSPPGPPENTGSRSTWQTPSPISGSGPRSAFITCFLGCRYPHGV